MSTTREDLQKIEKAIVKLRKKVGRFDINYTVQAAISSVDPTVVVYAAQLTAPADGLAPITFIGDKGLDDLLEQIKLTTKNVDYEAVEIAYHEAQIKACDRTKLGHEERIKAIQNPEPEEVAETNTDETKNEQDTTK